MYGSWRAAEARHCEKSGEGIVKLKPQQQLKAQDCRGHAEKLRVDTMKKAHERLWVKVQPSHSRRPTFWRCQSHGMPTTSSNSSGVGPAEARKPVCTAEGRSGKQPKPLEEPREL